MVSTANFFKAIDFDNVSDMRNFLSRGANIDMEKDGWSALNHAILKKSYNVALFLISHGASIDMRISGDHNGSYRPIAFLLRDQTVNNPRSKAYEVLEALLKRNVSFYDISQYHRNALHLCAHFGHANTFKRFLKEVKTAKELLEFKDKNGWSLTDSLSRAKNPELLRAYKARLQELSGKKKEHQEQKVSEPDPVVQAETIGDVDTRKYILIGRDTLQISQNLYDGPALSDVYNFSARKVTTVIPNGGPVVRRFDECDPVEIEQAAAKIKELEGDPGENWQEGLKGGGGVFNKSPAKLTTVRTRKPKLG